MKTAQQSNYELKTFNLVMLNHYQNLTPTSEQHKQFIDKQISYYKNQFIGCFQTETQIDFMIYKLLKEVNHGQNVTITIG